MKRLGFRVFLVGLGLLALASPAAAGRAAQTQPRVLAVTFDTEVNPVTQDYLSKQLHRAVEQHYDAVAILLDTPGGLSESMRKIVQDELATPIPVIVYVSPEGARAASAGVWIGQAADVLAMAPNTNIGSSTPINGNGSNIGSDLRRKVVNDAASSLRELARTHGRNVVWADAAVRKASNLTATEALRANVIDAMAPTLPALLRKLDGYTTVPRGFVLHLRGAAIDEAKPGFVTRFLNVLIDPNLVFLLFLAGLAGIGYEIFHPGVVLPGALGGVALLTAMFGLSILPISWAGLGLVLLGVSLLVVDLFVPTHGGLTLAGLLSLVAGGLLLFHDAPSPYQGSALIVIAVAVVLGGLWAFAVGKGIAARRRPVEVGPERVPGDTGVVRRGGMVFVDGELWKAHDVEGAPLLEGEHVKVERVEGGLVLAVRHTKEEE